MRPGPGSGRARRGRRGRASRSSLPVPRAPGLAGDGVEGELGGAADDFGGLARVAESGEFDDDAPFAGAGERGFGDAETVDAFAEHLQGAVGGRRVGAGGGSVLGLEDDAGPPTEVESETGRGGQGDPEGERDDGEREQRTPERGTRRHDDSTGSARRAALLHAEGGSAGRPCRTYGRLRVAGPVRGHAYGPDGDAGERQLCRVEGGPRGARGPWAAPGGARSRRGSPARTPRAGTERSAGTTAVAAGVPGSRTGFSTAAGSRTTAVGAKCGSGADARWVAG